MTSKTDNRVAKLNQAWDAFALSLDLHPGSAAEAEEVAVQDALDELSAACDFDKWYPENMFPPLSETELKQIGELLGGPIMSRLHAGWARHLAKVVRGEI